MAYLSVIALADRFQHADEPFFFKALTLGEVATSSIRLHYSPVPSRLSKLIGTSHSSMVGPSTPPVCRSVQWTPASFLSSRNSSWTSLRGTSLFLRQSPFGGRERHQMALFSRLVESLPCLGMALLVWDLEDISCPPAKQLLQLHHNKATTRDKMHAYLDWMSKQNLG